MEFSIKTLGRTLSGLRVHLGASDPSKEYAADEPPLRSELFSADQMEQHAGILANRHRLTPGRPSDRLLRRLAENESVLLSVYNLLNDAVKADRRVTPAGEWLLDNFYLLEEQIRTAKLHLPRGYSLELPRLSEGVCAGLPRVYDIALETISHGDGRIDPERFAGFVAAYQRVADLTLGELWAIPIMLRLALIENLRRVATRIATDRIDRSLADHWADQMIEIAGKDPKSLILVIADMARSTPPMVGSFVAEFARRLQGKGPALALPLTWIEQRLSESGRTIEQLVRSENQQQAVDQVSMSNSIGSLRFLGAMDWREFVETMSVVEHTLKQDPANIYAKMDFATRDRYRHVVEKTAKKSSHSESEVARQAIELANEGAARHGAQDRTAHVGFYLVDEGLTQLEALVRVRASLSGVLGKVGRRYPLPLYGGAILLISALLAALMVMRAQGSALHAGLLATVGLLSLLCASHLAVAVLNSVATFAATPHPLPRMDFREGIPPQSRSLVVVPAMLTSFQNIEDLIAALEVRFLANRDDHLHFGLLTDFRDALEESQPEDEPLLRLARQRIEELNEKYRSWEGDIFFLFHRPRRWNPGQGVWMGYERKRGKLSDLNWLLRAGPDSDPGDRFSLVVGKTAILAYVKYVITLDADTLLARDSARQFVAALAHPLNHAYYDEDKKRISKGYGILQPRVAISLPAANRSRYARLFANDPGVDPYTRAVSDVYQDLFAEGSFIGKGIYDVDAFERTMKDRLPANRILSHDLLEGCYARAGLLSDVQLYEEYPSSYSADVSRRHRWIRGDWQIGRWVLPGVPGPEKRFEKNPLSMLSRWKILDNLRRSLTPAALMLLLLLGWTLLPSAWFWTLSVTAIILIPSLLGSIQGVVQKPGDVTLWQHLGEAVRSAGRGLAQAGFMLVCLPYEAFFSLDAVWRTLWRLLITHRRLLEWNPSGGPDQNIGTDLAGSFKTMWAGPGVGAAAAITLALFRPSALVAAMPILGLWIVSPAVAWWISRPVDSAQAAPTTEQTLFLRKLARKTWAFFETFVGPEDNWLPPDNFQERPRAVVAHRTSPTNMGLALMANLSAYDFGYLSAGKFLERTANGLQTMEPLERHRGHFYNWYDTQSLKPLLPLYISSVDSGNLAGHLLTLRQGLIALGDEKIVGKRFLEGLADTLRVLDEIAGPAVRGEVARLRKELDRAALSRPQTLSQVVPWLEQLGASAAQTSARIDSVERFSEGEEPRWWAGAFIAQCRDVLEEIRFLAPWTGLLSSPDRPPDFWGIDEIPTLRQVFALKGELLPQIQYRLAREVSPGERAWLDELGLCVLEAGRRAEARLAAIEALGVQANELARMDYDFLYDKARHLLAIGYNVGEHRRDLSYYDLLASEARFATFVAISQGKLPQDSWFALGRILTTTGGEPILLSWSGSMFEYLMPLLVMPSYKNTLLDRTCKAAVSAQIEYGRKCGVPWGISESGYNAVDVQRNYQYRAFGVPGLGLKRGLAADLVIAPYASALALMVAPDKACSNLERLAEEGFEGKFGFHEAIDYTASRLPPGQSCAVVRSYMAHHQGMSFLALAHQILGPRMQKRFEAEPLFQATLLLLQERVPKATAFYAHTTELSELHATSSGSETPVRVFSSPNTVIPEVQLLSNGRYHVMVTNAGGGYSRWKDIALTRWREDSTCDNWGAFCYIRDLTGNEFWSTTYQPTLKEAQNFETIFSQGRAEFRCRRKDLDIYTEIVVSPEDDIELRRITITNRTRSRKEIDVTSYSEVVLAPPASEALHPAFSNLFVQTEILREQRAILCSRRPRSSDEQTPWMLHLMAVHGAKVGEVSYETDRMRFIGRGNTLANPLAMNAPSQASGGALSGTEGPVLDPIAAIRHRITIDPEKAATVNIVSGISQTRGGALSLVEKYQDRRLADRVFDVAWTHSQVLLRQINATQADAQLYCRLAGSIIYANASLRADPRVLIKNRRGQSGLWGYAISGDLPIVLLQIEDQANIDLVRQLVQAHAYWRLNGLAVDLVIWNEDHAGYRQLLHDQIMGLIAAGIEANVTDRPGGIFVRAADQIAEEDRILIQTVSRVIITDSRGSLADQINGRIQVEATIPQLSTRQTNRPQPAAPPPPPRHDLTFYNGLGGFTPDGREYVITTARGQLTPAPWVNVLANPHFGTVISESGTSYTWSENAHEFRLTPWGNDPVSDSGAEVFYLRDEERGDFWSPTPLPRRGMTPYLTRHGFGYTVFEHTERGIRSEMWVYVAMDAAVKFAVLKVRNESERARRLSATGYVEWVLGDLRPKSSMHAVTEIERETGALFARNPYNTEFCDHTAFFDVDDTARTVSGDRAEFLGRNGTLFSPAAMTRANLSGKVGAGLDPCGAIQVSFDLGAGQEREIIFRLGVGRDPDEAANLVKRFRGSMAASRALDAVWQHWTHTLGAVNVETPDQALNVLANGWLLYQTLACRLWARSGYYQSGGAFGFRDQLQDVLALVHARPHLVREHLLLCASRQFVEGDVQHWWHPPTGRGVRTHCSDDYLWLVLATWRYVVHTGDTGVLEEPVYFLQGRQVNEEEDSYYDLPGRGEKPESLYEHCVRAIRKGLKFGEHGLPLIGSGDWNDGMNLLGQHGKGESVWLGFFLYEVLIRFAEVARGRGDVSFAEFCENEAAGLRGRIEEHGWDGQWYRRAYFDDGTPLGSSVNTECRIDSISQSWSVLSGAGDPKRSRQAMEALDELLVRRKPGLVQLLDPPFDKSELNPGYIKGYVPGVRENGGQYTHAAIWAVMAFARLGDNRRAWELFSMINPVNHARSSEGSQTYKVEPYVVAPVV
jgi:cellobiose phosphorylase